MIRYSCDACGKSLRADEKIIGRKAPCTRCGAVTEIPARSTRESRKAKSAVPGQHDPAESESPSDEFIDLEDIDVGASPPAGSGILKSLKPQYERESESLNGSPETAGQQSEESFQPVFKVVERRPKKRVQLNPAVLAVAAAILLIGTTGYWLANRPVVHLEPQKTVFEQTPEALEYDTAMFELKKAKRTMVIMGNGYVTSRGLDESALDDLDELVATIEEATSDTFAMREANELFEQGKEGSAIDLLAVETKRLNELREQAERRTDEFRQKTYED